MRRILREKKRVGVMYMYSIVNDSLKSKILFFVRSRSQQYTRWKKAQLALLFYFLFISFARTCRDVDRALLQLIMETENVGV